MIQRYYLLNGDEESGLIRAATLDTGIAVKYADHERALAVKDAEIARLREAVITYKRRHESGGPLSEVREDSCRCSACDNARAALETRNG